jgi:Uri superfamily endonuclease
VTAKDLPEAKETYVLIASVAHMKRLEIVRLGAYAIVPEHYACVGSASGAGGLRSRIGHHLESSATQHWHIDYLLDVAEPVEVWYTTAIRKLEHPLAELVEKAPRFRVPVPRFGSSDYHRSRSSHLFYCRRRPTFQWFQRLLIGQFEGVRTERYAITRCHGGEPLSPLVHEEFNP